MLYYKKHITKLYQQYHYIFSSNFLTNYDPIRMVKEAVFYYELTLKVTFY